MSVPPRPFYRFGNCRPAPPSGACVDERDESFDGDVFTMTGASWKRNLITANLTRELHARLQGPPRLALSNDMRVRVESANVGACLDLAVILWGMPHP